MDRLDRLDAWTERHGCLGFLFGNVGALVFVLGLSVVLLAVGGVWTAATGVVPWPIVAVVIAIVVVACQGWNKSIARFPEPATEAGERVRASGVVRHKAAPARLTVTDRALYVSPRRGSGERVPLDNYESVQPRDMGGVVVGFTLVTPSGSWRDFLFAEVRSDDKNESVLGAIAAELAGANGG